MRGPLYSLNRLIRPEWVILLFAGRALRFLLLDKRRSEFYISRQSSRSEAVNQPYRPFLTYLYLRLLTSARRECGQTLPMPRK
jgi:hypothetical protein